MRINFPYPGGYRSLEIPDRNILAVGTPERTPKLSNTRAKILETIRSPLGTEALATRAKEGVKVCLLVDDVTRRTPIAEVLPVVIDELVENGVKEEDIKIWIARGMHRDMTLDEQKEKVGREIYERFKTSVHNYEDLKNLVFIGETSRGTPIWVNKSVVESDLIIGIGGVLFHWFAGYGGGAKIVLPGICGRRTIQPNHNILDPNCSACRLEGNPLRNEMEEVARRAGLYMKIDCVMNSSNELVDLYAGDSVAEHRQAVRKYEKIYGITLPKKAEIVLTSTMPKYQTFTQGVFMPLCSMYEVTTDDATIIIDCPVSEGYSFATKGFAADMKAKLTLEQLNQRVKESSIFEAISFYHAARIREQRNVIVVSNSLTEDEMIQTGFTHAPTIEEALEKAFARHGQETQLAVIPYGFSSVPRLAA
jgi:nickel-dependent lactate racemase